VRRTVRNRLRGVECPLVAGRGAVARLILDVRSSGWRPPSDGDLAADRHWREGRWAEGPARGQGRLTARAPEVWVRCSTISLDAACAVPSSSPSMARRGWRARSLLCGTACQRSSAQCTGSAACWRMRRSGCTRHAVCSRPKPLAPAPALLVVIGLRPDGQKVVLAGKAMDDESTRGVAYGLDDLRATDQDAGRTTCRRTQRRCCFAHRSLSVRSIGARSMVGKRLRPSRSISH
jgi:hypothetical protein